MCNLDKIVDRCKKGDRKAGEQLYHMFSAKMFAVCIQYSKSREEAEDNLQDGFIKVLESISQYKGKGSFEGWMKRIFINTALEKFRKNRSVQVVEEVPEVVDEDDIDDFQKHIARFGFTGNAALVTVSDVFLSDIFTAAFH